MKKIFYNSLKTICIEKTTTCDLTELFEIKCMDTYRFYFVYYMTELLATVSFLTIFIIFFSFTLTLSLVVAR